MAAWSLTMTGGVGVITVLPCFCRSRSAAELNLQVDESGVGTRLVSVVRLGGRRLYFSDITNGDTWPALDFHMDTLNKLQSMRKAEAKIKPAIPIPKIICCLWLIVCLPTAPLHGPGFDVISLR
jgi:hypothetical protein